MRRMLLLRIKERGGFAAIYDRIAAGETLVSIGKDYNVSPRFLKVTITANDKLDVLFRQARADSAAALVEKNLEELEAFKPSSLAAANAEVSLLKLRTEHRKWLAGVYDKEFFGEKKQQTQVNLQLNMGDLHLEALRKLPRTTARLLESGNTLDVETVP